MTLAIVAYPTLDETDRQWIESFRARHDPQSSRIDVHFTLVFPVEVPPSELEPELITVAETTQPISFVIDRTEVVPDAFGQGHHVFLVPSEGGARIATLHDRLYAGLFKRHLRSDIPFVPHLTVGAAPDSGAAERLAGGLRAPARLVRGSVSRIDMVNVDAHRVETIASYPLRRPIQSHL